MNKKQIEKEFKTWVKKFGETNPTIDAKQVKDGNKKTWVVTMYKDSEKHIFDYLGKGKFTHVAVK